MDVNPIATVPVAPDDPSVEFPSISTAWMPLPNSPVSARIVYPAGGVSVVAIVPLAPSNMTAITTCAPTIDGETLGAVIVPDCEPDATLPVA